MAKRSFKGGLHLVAKNAAANVIRGGATATVALVLPRFLTKLLSADRFAAWSLVLQIAGYAGFLDFGLQTAVSRFVAHDVESGDKNHVAQLIRTATVLLTVCSLGALLIIGLCIWQSETLFRGVPSTLRFEFSEAALVLSISACLLLPLSTYTGVLVGMRNNQVPALAVGGSRIVGAASAIAAAHVTRSLPVLALCVGVPNVIGGLVQRVAVTRQLGSPRPDRLRVWSWPLAKSLIRFCGGLTINAFALLLIGGLDLTIVGHYDFSAVGFYSIAGAAVSFVSGLTYAGLNAILAPITALHARGEHGRVRDVLLGTTRLVVALNVALSICTFVAGRTALELWVGPVYSQAALPLLKILVVAQAVRLVMAPFSVALVSVGSPEKGVPGAICEAVVNLSASVAGAIYYGPVGVAVGTLIGACCGLCWNLFAVLPRGTNPAIGAAEFLQQGVLPSCLPFLPLLAFGVVKHLLPLPAQAFLFVLCLAGAAFLGKRLALHTARQTGFI